MKIVMGKRQLLKRLAFEVNELLNRYIEIHNLRHEEAASFFSLFRKVDFKKIHLESYLLLKMFVKKYEEINSIEANDPFNQKYKLNCVEREFYGSLLYFYGALFRCVIALFNLSNAQYLKSVNKLKLSFRQNQELEKEYQKWINEYFIRGKKLNELYDNLGKIGESFDWDDVSHSKGVEKTLGEKDDSIFDSHIFQDNLKNGLEMKEEKKQNQVYFLIATACIDEEMHIFNEKLEKTHFPSIYAESKSNPDRLKEEAFKLYLRVDFLEKLEERIKNLRQYPRCE